jgi:hypothetical protein
MSDPACRTFRELLGVYVVGAIEPNERSVLDAHLNQCYGCREELAGLAVLPAMLHRIPIAEAEPLMRSDQDGQDNDDPAPRVLSGLLTEVRTRRRARRLRGVLAAAAAIVIAVGGSVAVSAVVNGHSHAPMQALDVASAYRDGMSVTVEYGELHWGTEMWVQVHGIPENTRCQFWVVTSGGRTVHAGGWRIGPDGDVLWYRAKADIREPAVTGFVLTSAGKVLFRIPAS